MLANRVGGILLPIQFEDVQRGLMWITLSYLFSVSGSTTLIYLQHRYPSAENVIALPVFFGLVFFCRKDKKLLNKRLQNTRT